MRQKHLFEHPLTPSSIHPAGRLARHTAFRSFGMLLVALAAFGLASSAARADDALPTRTSLAAAPAGAGATLTATVRTATGAAVTTGSVDYLLASGQSLGSAPVGPDGLATLALAHLPAGSPNAITGAGQLGVSAVFHATAAASNYAESSSVVTTVAAPEATGTPNFTVTGNPTTLTVTQGSYGATAITITSLAGYTGAIELSCSNLPARVTCAFNPTQQTLAANGTFVSSLQLQTEAPSGTASSALRQYGGGLALALVLPGGLLLIGSRRRSRQMGQVFGMVLLLCGAGLGLSGCSQRYGYLKHPAPVSPGTPTGTYTVTVAVDGSQGSSVIENDLNLTLVVN